jgi:hypothetical protein
MNFLHSHAAVSLALACVLWTVQLVIYPAFRFIDAGVFHRWHHNYTGAITWVVAPLILIQTGGVAGRLVVLGTPDWLWITECVCTAVAWAVTVFVSVPLHTRLQRLRNEEDMRKLVWTNWLRTVSWSATAVCSWLAAGRE